MKVVVVYNPKSGSAQPRSVLTRLFKQADIKVEGFIDVTKNFDMSITKYKNQSNIVVVGYGGDGTLSSIASQLVGTHAVFAPLPGGTLNHFTKDLGIDQDLKAAINRLTTAKIRMVDTARVNGRLFLNNSSIGLYPSSLTERSRIESSLGKWPAAIYASIRAFVRFKLYTVTIAHKTYKTPFIFVGNNRYDVESFMARKSITNGVLNVHMITTTQRRALLKIAVLAIIGRAKQAEEFKTFETNDLTIHIKKHAVRVSYDGEHAKLSTPIHYEIQKKSLRVLR